jgi:predicted flap endonuclease-1-like 5' DNA nuclease
MAPTQPSGDLPRIGAPATRALANIGITTLAGVAKYSEAELAKLHGMGPKALGILKQELKKQGKGFKAK